MDENKVENVENEKVEEKKRTTKSYIIEFAIYVFLILFCLFIVPKYIMQRTVVSGSSMKNTLHNGESLLVDKVSYLFKDPERYDIIVFYPKGKDVDDDSYYVKRIFGLPGETVQIKGTNIFINGKEIKDGYAKDGSMEDPGVAEKPFKLKDDEYFVLGDNRDESLDSRVLPEEDSDAPGPVKKENIAGRVMIRVWPLSQFGVPK